MMDDRAIARVKAVVAALGVLTASVGGAFALGLVGAPSVVDVENRFGDVNDERTMILTDLVVNNPNPIGVRLGGSTVNYTVYMNDVEIAHGSKAGLDVDSGNTTLPFRTRMRNDRIPPWWVSHIRNDEVTNVTIDATVQTSVLGNRSFDLNQRKQVETDIISAFASDETRPVNGPENPLYSNPVLYINRTDAEWGQVDRQETPIPMEFVVYNPQLKPYTITEVGYDITMNNISMGSGATDETYVIPGESTETLRTTPTIDNGNLDEWWVSHLQNDQETTLRIDFYAKVELPTGNEIRVPLDRMTYVQEFETDIFGTKNESGDTTGSTPTPTPASGGGESGAGAATATPSPTEATGGLVGDETSTSAPGATPAATPTEPQGPTATSTDDGGLIGAVMRVVPIGA
ncbi:LEA type 2 family protein [Haloglomus halophilum]|uniref:LEA type 2 family protein n=1 Tax=Haloglomus halophilum TaxID=2962672 RepID=UPI0020C9E412|nr:LEA type 2 family protein [Haloglomus halophilum]